jgi:hypothetical protein
MYKVCDSESLIRCEVYLLQARPAEETDLLHTGLLQSRSANRPAINSQFAQRRNADRPAIDSPFTHRPNAGRLNYRQSL